jgi:Domain of unknown function (DUF1707)
MRASRRRPAYRPPEVRACDADRDVVIDELRERFADGSLAHESFVFRVDAALRARRHGELAEILADLPAPRGRSPAPLSAAWLRPGAPPCGVWLDTCSRRRRPR